MWNKQKKNFKWEDPKRKHFLWNWLFLKIYWHSHLQRFQTFTVGTNHRSPLLYISVSSQRDVNLDVDSNRQKPLPIYKFFCILPVHPEQSWTIQKHGEGFHCSFATSHPFVLKNNICLYQTNYHQKNLEQSVEHCRKNDVNVCAVHPTALTRHLR